MAVRRHLTTERYKMIFLRLLSHTVEFRKTKLFLEEAENEVVVVSHSECRISL